MRSTLISEARQAISSYPVCSDSDKRCIECAKKMFDSYTKSNNLTDDSDIKYITKVGLLREANKIKEMLQCAETKTLKDAAVIVCCAVNWRKLRW